MGEMVDRVAKAIFEGFDWNFAPGGRFEDQELHLQEIFRDLAKRAMIAIQDPTDAMVNAASDDPYLGDRLHIRLSYEAMIAAALK